MGERRQSLVFIGIVTGTAIVSFYLGFVAHIETNQVNLRLPKAQNDPLQAGVVASKGIAQTSPIPSNSAKILTSGAYVASKNGTKYYSTGCSGAKRIKDANKVFFETANDAEAQGYSRASGC